MYLRKGNIKFSVLQNNKAQKLLIEDYEKMVDNRADGDFFEYEQKDLVGKDFRDILPDEIKELVDDNIEFSYEGYDFKDVLEKIINFKILSKSGKGVDMNIHIERQISTAEKLSFSAVLDRKIFLKEKIKNIIASVSEVQKVAHDKTSLMNASTYSLVVDEVLDFLYEFNYNAVFMAFSIESYPFLRRQYGKKKADDILTQVSYVMKSTFRGRDIIGYLGMGKFGILMVNTFEEEVEYPIMRMRANLKRENLLTSKMSYNVRFQKVDLELKVADLIDTVSSKKVDFNISSS